MSQDPLQPLKELWKKAFPSGFDIPGQTAEPNKTLFDQTTVIDDLLDKAVKQQVGITAAIQRLNDTLVEEQQYYAAIQMHQAGGPTTPVIIPSLIQKSNDQLTELFNPDNGKWYDVQQVNYDEHAVGVNEASPITPGTPFANQPLGIDMAFACVGFVISGGHTLGAVLPGLGECAYALANNTDLKYSIGFNLDFGRGLIIDPTDPPGIKAYEMVKYIDLHQHPIFFIGKDGNIFLDWLGNSDPVAGHVRFFSIGNYWAILQEQTR
jgi:hypothetical protein